MRVESKIRVDLDENDEGDSHDDKENGQEQKIPFSEGWFEIDLDEFRWRLAGELSALKENFFLLKVKGVLEEMALVFI